MEREIKQFEELVAKSKTILVLQPEKPDTDSMTSSLALEQILGDLDKEVILYCKDDIPGYISYFEGADRVHDTFPKSYDFAILVDTGGPQQINRTLEKFARKLSAKPMFIIDHHPNREEIPLETINLIDPQATSTCEVVMNIAKDLGWKINKDAANILVPGILADTRGLSVPTTTPANFRMVADLMDAGADIAKIHQNYREADAKSVELQKFRGELLARIETYCEGKIGLVYVAPNELKQYARQHDPSDLVIYDLQWSIGVEVAVVLRDYGGKIKISTRAARLPVAAEACREFGGGGHDRAAGCQINATPPDEAKAKFVKVLCQKIKDYEAANETV